MFGLNDNSNTNSDLSANSMSNNTTMPPLQTDVSGSSSVSSPSPSINTAPPAAVSDSTPPAPEPPAPAPEPTPAAPSLTQPSPTSSTGIGELNLDDAYITNDKPTIGKSTGSSFSEPPAQPTAASMLNNSAAGDDDLLKIKQQALQSLAPLVDHLDQNAEEKFKTTMMLIQASDNADLIPEAYEAAGKITDDKVRAQALLDVVNEINYFTHHNNQ